MFAARAAFMAGGTPPPTYASVSPAAGKTGDTITVTGTNFVTGSTTVTVGGLSATSVSVTNATTLTCAVPSGLGHATAYAIAITTPGGTATSGSVFTNYNAPTVTSSSPSSGLAGATLTLGGTNFIVGGTSVTVGGIAAGSVNVSSTSALTCTVPAGLTQGSTYDIIVTTAGGSGTRSAAFTASYIAPTIGSFSTIPNGGSSGSVTITGTNFYAGASVSVGGTAATSVVVNSTTSITCTFPAKATGTYSVTVTSLGGTSAGVNAAYPAPPITPVITSALPTYGPTSNATYYVFGSGFNASGTLAVQVDGSWIPGTFATIDSDGQAHWTQAIAAGAHSVQVYNYSGGYSNTVSPAFYTYNAPTLSSVSPTSGLAGSSATLTGTNFIVGTTTCSVSGTAATCTASSTTSATITIPSIAAGAKTISVSTYGGTSGTVAFTVTVPAPTVSSTADGRSGNGSLTGSTISIVGANFTGASVTCGGTAVSATVTATTISFACPTFGTDGTKTIAITTTGGTVNTSVYYWIARISSASTFTSGSGTFTPPQWANSMDVVVRGGGGSGGGSSVAAWGAGGSAGAASGGTFNLISTGFAARSYSVGAGGAQVGTSVRGNNGTASTAAGLSGAGGAGGLASNNGVAGTGGTALTQGGITSPAPTGGAAGTSAQPGANPGSGGGGGNSALGPYNGIAGRAGAVYFRVYQ